MNDILVYLYDETGSKEEIAFDENIIDNLNDRAVDISFSEFVRGVP